MANLIYRLTSDTPVRSTSTVKNLPLSNVEIDGNFKVIDNDLNTKAPLASPALTGIPTAPTAAAGTNTTQLATTAHVFAERSNVATLTNKTISADNNSISGIAASSFVLTDGTGAIDGAAAQKAIPAGVVVGTTDTQTLTNKTISVDNNTVSGVAASSFVLSNASGNIDGAAAQKAIPAGVVVGTTDTQTLTNKTISGANNTISNIGNSSLTNSSVTVNGTAISLGGSATITAANPSAVTFNNGGSGAVSGTTYSGSAAVTISYNTVGAPSTTGINASGTWGISITGNAVTATSAITASRLGTVINHGGVSFNAVAGSHYLIWASGVTATLPSSPSVGDTIQFTAYVSNWTIARNGKYIMGLAENMSVDLGGAAESMVTFTLRFIEDGSSTGWVVY